jgi:hypothetical protein
VPSEGKLFTRYKRAVCLTGDLPQFVEFSKKESDRGRNCVYVDQVVYSTEEKEPLLNLLRELIFNNIVSDGTTFFRQHTGIPQGSILSPLLCSLFYADLEKKKLGDLVFSSPPAPPPIIVNHSPNKSTYSQLSQSPLKRVSFSPNSANKRVYLPPCFQDLTYFYRGKVDSDHFSDHHDHNEDW